MLDIEAFPHIRQAVLESADRDTLTALIRLSSRTRMLALPYLYTDPLPDPFGPRASASQTDWRLVIRLPAQRVKAKVESFLHSPHLALCKQIHITHPEVLAGHLSRLQTPPTPAVRGEDTSTVIWAKPFVAGSDQSVRVDGEGNVIPKKEKSKVIKAGGAPTMSWETLHDGFKPGQKEFLHIMEISSLLPSSRLILVIPPASDIDVRALLNAMCVIYDNPQNMRELVIICGSGNRITSGATSILHERFWNSITLVLVPDADGTFEFVSPPADGSGYEPMANLDPDLAHMPGLFATPTLALRGNTAYSIVGLEGIKTEESVMEALQRQIIVACTMFGRVGALEIVALEQWKETAAVEVRGLV